MLRCRDTRKRATHTSATLLTMLTAWVALLVELGRLDAACEIARRLIEFDPGFSVARNASYAWYATRPKQERLVDALRLAGLPE